MNTELSRRQFLAAAAGAVAVASGQTPLQAGAARRRKVLHMIGSSHIDLTWLWPWQDGLSAAITTFQSAVDRMREFPGFSFTAPVADDYQWVQKTDSRLWA